jgi:8-oxo-dGTP pyrophosphatase MutT (NUDIX family)/ribosomal protein S18 acetylase RimI-like enzyme
MKYGMSTILNVISQAEQYAKAGETCQMIKNDEFIAGHCHGRFIRESGRNIMTEYIKSMRKHIGHERLLIVGASVFIHKDGRLLLQKRKDNGCWGDHGGCCELGETVEETAKRELLEEAGLTACSLKLLGIFSGKDLFYTYPNGDMVSNVNIAYLCEDFIGELLTQTNEITDLRWFSVDALPDNISPPVKPALVRCVEVLRERMIKTGKCEPCFIVEKTPFPDTIKQFVSVIRGYEGEYFFGHYADSVAIDAPYQQLCYLRNGDELLSGIMFTCLDGSPHITVMATQQESKNKGYGKQLIEQFACYVSQLGFHDIELYAWSEKTRPACVATQAFYKSLGFVVTSEHMGLWEKDKITVKMKKAW